MPPAANIPLNVAAVAAAAKQVLAGLGPIAPPQTPLPPIPLASAQKANPAAQVNPTQAIQAMPQTSKVFDMRLMELSGQAHREVSGAIMSGILAAQDASKKTLQGLNQSIKDKDPKDQNQGLFGLSKAALSAAAGLASFHAVALASPGTMERFQLAINDTTAVVGRVLVPVVEFLTSIIRTVGDVLATILPPASTLREILQPIAQTFRSLMEALAPIITIIKNVLLVALKALAIAVQVVMIPINFLVGIIQGLIGSEEKLASSVGAAARNISFTSSDAAQKQAYAAIYKNSQGGGMEGMVSGISKTLSDIGEDVRAIAEKIGAAARTAATVGRTAVGIGTLGASEGIRGVNNAIAGVNKITEAYKGKAPSEAATALGQAAAPGPFKYFFGKKEEEKTEEETGGANDWMQRLIDQSKRRFHDGHPGGH